MFTATSIGQADYGLEHVVRELNVEGARLAREAADEAGADEQGEAGSHALDDATGASTGTNSARSWVRRSRRCATRCRQA